MFGGGRINQTDTNTDIQEGDIVKSVKYLGTLLDESLSFCDHVDYVYKTAQQRAFYLLT